MIDILLGVLIALLLLIALVGLGSCIWNEIRNKDKP